MRLLALDCIQLVLHRQRKMECALDNARALLESPRDRALLHQLVSGVLRHFFTLQADWSRFTNHKPEPVVQAALLLGTLQLRHLKVADHAAIHTTVEAVKQRDPRRVNLVNAILRKVSSNQPPKRYKPYQRAELPQWIYAQWRDAFGAETVTEIARCVISVPALAMAAMHNRDALLAQWQESDIDASAGDIAPQAIMLPAATDVTALPGWSEGACTVIDQSAQLAAWALPASEGLCLDFCSAPGGKYALLHARMGRVVALELMAPRLPRWQDNTTRLALNKTAIVQADALTPPFKQAVADRIMLDAPCSASGLLRRHPDVKFLHDNKQIDRLVKTQNIMLLQALALLKTGGILAYTVCSIHPAENEAIINHALQRDGITPYPLPDLLHPFAIAEGMARIFPSATCDGFFIALLQKQ
ncbi:MAG: transcription antitermination factor NusB [Mariprofundales bacterium]